jgi:hypothetical protein
LCSPECFETAIERGALGRALRHQGTNAEFTRLRATLCKASTETTAKPTGWEAERGVDP